jgi:hypothetical protein
MSEVSKWIDLDPSLLYPDSGMPIYPKNPKFLATRNSKGQYMLAARIIDNGSLGSLPALKGIGLNVEKDGPGNNILSLTLEDSSSVDLQIFSIFCKELADETMHLDGIELVNQSVATLKSWSEWFSALNDGLSQIKLIGLLGEMYALNNYLIPALGNDLAIRAWLGPEGAQQDFVADNFSIEVKAHHSGFIDKIHISSIGQLDSVATEKFFILKVDFSSSENHSSYSLLSLSQSIAKQLSRNPSALSDFTKKYNSIVMGASEDKLIKSFSLVSESIYEVTDKFPMIKSDDLDSAIIKSTIEYAIDVSQIKDFLIQDKSLGQLI